MSLCLHRPIIACNRAPGSKRAAGLRRSATHDCTLEAMRTQARIPNVCAPLTIGPPIRGRRPDCSEVAMKMLILEFGPTYDAFIFMGGL